MMDDGIMTGIDIKKYISSFTDSPSGFEVYLITKSEPCLKKMSFLENSTNNLRYKLRDGIVQVLRNKYLSDEAEYALIDRIADEQRKLYIIPISENYNPLAVLNTPAGIFRKEDVGEATGIAFMIRLDNRVMWAYQHLWSIMVPNKSRKHKLGRLISGSKGDMFEECTEPIITFAEKVDLLVIENYIIASDYKLLQNQFGFYDYIRMSAEKTICAIQEKGLVANINKLTEYAQRGNGRPKYAKKLMRIADSTVLKMNRNKLWENIHKSKRWNGKIKEENGQFVLETYTQVENLIDLLDERYTRSDITEEEYDTEVKQIAEPI